MAPQSRRNDAEPTSFLPRTGLLIEMLLAGILVALAVGWKYAGLVDQRELAIPLIGYQAFVILVWPWFQKASACTVSHASISGPNADMLTRKLRVTIPRDSLDVQASRMTSRWGRRFGYTDLHSFDGRRIRIIHRLYGEEQTGQLLRLLGM